MRRISYIHERATWPRLTWDTTYLAAALAAVRHKQGRLLGKMEGLGFDLRNEASLGALTTEVVKSSAIEGEALSPEEVRSSIASRLGLNVAGLPKASRDVDGIVEVMLDATGNYQAKLTKPRLFDWHAALFPTGRNGMGRITVGAWRRSDSGPMHVVSGPLGKERVHFEAPESGRVEKEMAGFLAWFNGPGPVDPVLRAAVAQFWFVTIHPFDDGNGRIARAIAEMALAHADGTRERFYSMSSQIAAERKEYYVQLESAQRGDTDITVWLTWFLDCLDRALDAADKSLAAVMNKANLWQKINRRPVNERQRLVINRMLGAFDGYLTTSKYAKLAGCSNDTALRDIQELLKRCIVLANPGAGRSTSYRLGSPDDVIC